jgi:two-component system, OmpR family, alkaline phosphatase synthesis response regulator PhoP
MEKAKPKILIVDDDPDLGRGLTIRLRANNYETIQATDGRSAFALAKEQNPSLVILDLGLPDGDGFTVLENLQKSGTLSSVPVIVLTARDPHFNELKTLKAGAFAFVQKPADNSELLAMIRAAISVPREKGVQSDLTG